MDVPTRNCIACAKVEVEVSNNQAADGLHLTAFLLVQDQVAAATYGLDLLEELPTTRVESHYDSYRLFFGSDHIDISQAVALEYYEMAISLGVLRAASMVPLEYRTLCVMMDRFPGQSPECAIPGESVASTPGARFLHFVRQHTATAQHIQREQSALGVNAVLSTLDWWQRPGSTQWQAGKTHPHFVLPDWLAAAALAEFYPDEVASSFPNASAGADAVSGLRELYTAFQRFDIWSLTGVEMLKSGSKHWSVPDAVRTFVLNRAGTR
jgi:hypothetical protein